MVALRFLLLVAAARACQAAETTAVESPSLNVASLLQTAHRAGATVFPRSSFAAPAPSKHPALALLEESRLRAAHAAHGGDDDDDDDDEVESGGAAAESAEVPQGESKGGTTSKAASVSDTVGDATASEATLDSGSALAATTVEPIVAGGGSELEVERQHEVANQSTLVALDKANEAANSDESREQGSAAQAAGEVAAQLSIQSSKEEEAEEMERKAAELRTKAAKLTQAMTKEARKAGEDAAGAKMEEVTKALSEMYERARQAQIHSVVLQTSAKLLLNEANDFTAAAGHILHGDAEAATPTRTSTQ